MNNIKYPYDESTEANIIGAILGDNKNFVHASKILTKDCFYVPLYSAIYEAIEKIISRRQIASCITLKYYLSQDLYDLLTESGLARMADQPLVWVNFQDFCNHLKTLYLRRQILDFSKSINEIALSNKNVDVGDQFSEALIGARKIIAFDNNEIEAPYIDAERLANPVATGYLEMNKLLKGGFHKSNFILLGARPAIGKSAFALNLAMDIESAGKNVLFISFEMSSSEISERMACRHYLNSFEEIKKQMSIDEINSTLKGKNIFIADKVSTDIHLLKQYITAVLLNRKIDLIIIDHLHLMKSRTGSNGKSAATTKYDEMSAISRILKETAMETNLPILALAQLSRRPDRTLNSARVKSPPREPMLSDLRDSGSLEQDADVVILMHVMEQKLFSGITPIASSANFSAIDYKKVKIIVEKHRNGNVGDLYFRFYPEKMLFEEDQIMFSTGDEENGTDFKPQNKYKSFNRTPTPIILAQHAKEVAKGRGRPKGSRKG